MTNNTIAVRALFLVPLVIGEAYIASAQIASAASVLCGRVAMISCQGATSDVGLMIVSSSGQVNWIRIPADRREQFGSRIEDRYDQRLICLSTTARESSTYRSVRGPGDIALIGVNSSALPNDIARTCDPDVRLPRVIKDVKPGYTAEAMRAKINGSVFMRGIVNSDGSVRDVLVVKPLEPSLDTAAREALAQWRFYPAIRNGQSVAIAISVQMAFMTP